jgi:outer membrane protein assembly factor BamB
VAVGEGYATPLVVGNAVYTFTRRDGQEVMTALDAGSGRVRWTTGYTTPYTPSKPSAAHGAGPKATPLYHEGRLFTLGVSGIVSAFDASDGRRLWYTNAPSEPPIFSAAASPAGQDQLIFTHPGNYGPLTAFDAATGAMKWQGSEGGFYASPILADLGGVRQVVTVLGAHVVGVSWADGSVLWQYPWPALGGATTPIQHGDAIIVSGIDMGVAAFRPARHGDRWAAEPLWATKDVSLYVSNAVVVDETLYGLSHRARGQFFALDAASGKVLWLGQPREAENTAIVKAGTLLFLLNDDAELIVARANRSRFDPIARYTVADSATWAQPAISGDRIFIKDASSITLWTVEQP